MAPLSRSKTSLRPVRTPAVQAPAPILTPYWLADGRELTLRVEVNPRARRISVRLDPVSRHVVAVAPSWRYADEAAAFARTRERWVAVQLARLPAVIRLEPGAVIPIRGEARTLIRQAGRGPTILAPDALIACVADEALFAGRVRRFLQAEAKVDLAARVQVHAQAIGVRPARLSVKDTASRWGSATSAGALNFSWRVILAPPFVLDYLAAHEVAHLREMNHGPRFWRLVGQCIPDYARAEAWLDRYGAGLHAIDPKGGA